MGEPPCLWRLVASARDLLEGDVVRVHNALGEVECPLSVGAWIRPGTVSLPKGLWRKSTRNQWTATALVPDALTDLGGGACFNDARVEVTLLERPAERARPTATGPKLH